MKQVKEKQEGSTTTTLASYKCTTCKDTGWINGDNGYRRCKCVVKEHQERMWKAYGLDPSNVKTVKEFIPYDDLTKAAQDKTVNYIKNFNGIKESRENWAIFLGQPGSGKSHLTQALGVALMNFGFKATYMPYTEVIQELKGNAVDLEAYNKILNKYKGAEVLIIDDLFKDKVKNGELVGRLSEVDLKHIYPLINYRYNNNLPTVISSECDPEMLLTLDGAIGSRILEKSKGHITVFEGENYNYRLKAFC